MQIFDSLYRVIQMVIGLALLAWFGYGFYITYQAKQFESELANYEPAEVREPAPTFARERPSYGSYSSYGSEDAYTAPTDDTSPTANEWGY